MNNVAIVGAGIIGMTNAVRLLEKGFSVTVFTKDEPLNTNSDAAVANWFTSDDSKPLLQRYCLESITKFSELMDREGPRSGVQRIPLILYFKSKEDFEKSVWARESLRKSVNLTDAPPDRAEVPGFPFAVLIHNFLIHPAIYRPYMLKKFTDLGGKLKNQKINSLSELIDDYAIVINSAGWEAEFLTKDSDVYPIRGQTETMEIPKNSGNYSLNVEGIDAYVVFRPLTKDCVIGTTYQIGDSGSEVRESDKRAIIEKISKFFPYVSGVKTTSKAGVRCGRSDVRVEMEKVKNTNGVEKLIIHCYGHGGSGYSASLGTADEVVKYCLSFIHNMKPRLSI
ncbi:MAG: FAD-dependent oxidoreductase [Pseudomonadota bacterium]